MARIYRYPVDAQHGVYKLTVPEKFRILSAQMQGGRISIWAVVDDTSTTTRIIDITVVATGAPIPNSGASTFIDTVQDRQYVWHVFGEAS